MPLPDSFSEWEHLQSTLIQVHNREVREEFNDADDDDIATPRSSLKHACLIKDNDTIEMTLIRQNFFWFNLRKAQDLQAPIYGIPVEDWQSRRKHRPQIKLHFTENLEDVEFGYSPVAGEIGFRLEKETDNTLTESNLHTLATRIKTSFASNNGFIWRKGKEMVAYSDWDKGYQLQLLCRDKAEGKRIIEQVLDIQQHTPNWAKMTHNQTEEITEAYPTNPGTQVILGKSRRKPRKRPIADVVFRYATIDIWGLPHPICLVDSIYRFKKSILRAN